MPHLDLAGWTREIVSADDFAQVVLDTHRGEADQGQKTGYHIWIVEFGTQESGYQGGYDKDRSTHRGGGVFDFV